ncbi:MAG: Cytochrome c protein [Deltaproteobacteria bacterium]|nr:Cytochrome c protein [Deltaproteobacteria bacterium]MBM2838373.1 Cytochrome c protein [Deltaproteobacteria bacterium]
MKKLVVAVSVLSLFGATSAMAKTGAEIFKATCTACHGAAGEGKKALGPALKGNEFVVKGSDADISATIKDGRTGAAKKYKEFPSPMPAQKALTDAEIADLVSYIKGDIQK